MADENQRYHVVKLRPDVYSAIANHATAKGITMSEAARELFAIAATKEGVTMDESANSGSNGGGNNQNGNAAITASGQGGLSQAILGADLVRLGLELGAKLADLESRDRAQEVAIKALAVGFGDHLNQHDREDVVPQDTRELMYKTIQSEVEAGNLRGPVLEYLGELWGVKALGAGASAPKALEAASSE